MEKRINLFDLLSKGHSGQYGDEFVVSVKDIYGKTGEQMSGFLPGIEVLVTYTLTFNVYGENPTFHRIFAKLSQQLVISGDSGIPEDVFLDMESEADKESLKRINDSEQLHLG